MTVLRPWRLVLAASLLCLGGCAARPVNPRLARYEKSAAHQFEKLELKRGAHDDLVILAFSGGGTRAAAFSFGALEALRRIEIPGEEGRTINMLDEVDLITGVSGGSFTALAYGLYGDRLFTEYETRFLKRDVQRALITRTLNPLNWSALMSSGWGRSELAADFYDEVLFEGATFTDLERKGGPAIAVSATDLESGSRVVFIPQNFDVMCADLGSFRLARAAAASSAVPVVLSPLTINNYGGHCGYEEPDWLRQFTEAAKPPRPAGRILKRLEELRKLDEAAEDPYFHLVDGGISDNLGLRGVLDYLEVFEALRSTGQPTPLDHVRRIIIFVVNSVSSPTTAWNSRDNPPGTLAILEKAAGVPIDRYASESVELLKDIDARWTALREIRASASFAKSSGSHLTYVANAPDADIHAIEVSFDALKDARERDHLNQLPTSFHLADEDVDRLRRAAASVIFESPDLRNVLNEEHAAIEPDGAPSQNAPQGSAPASGHAPAPHAGGGPPHWEYDGEDGPSHWGDLDPAFATCRLGHLQSPIDIPAASIKREPLPPIRFDYRAAPLRVSDNGHTEMVVYPKGSTIHVGSTDYALLQIHFHRPSEERIDGQPFAMVAHLVHQKKGGGLAVVAVLFREGADNLALARIFDHLPKAPGQEEALAGVAVDASALLPPDKSYFTFQGSLTTPPCSEGVTWFVLRTPVTASAAQIGAFARHYAHNARPVQPVAGRQIRASQ